VHGPRPDGRYWGAVELDRGVDGRRRRRYVYAPTPRETADRLVALRRQVDDGALPTGAAATTGQWLEHWLATIAGPTLRPRTREQYAWAVKRAKPHVGGVPLGRLAPEHLEAMYAQLAKDGLGPASVLVVHRRIRTALRVAEERRRIGRSPAELVAPPKVPHREMRALQGAEVAQVVAAAAQAPGGARWLFALAMGARSGEVLGLTWDRVDLDAGVVNLSRQLQRAGGAWALVDVKSEAGRRRLQMPAQLVDVLREHRAQQVAHRLAMGPAWVGSPLGELVFPTVSGQPMHRSVDRKAWLRILRAAKVPAVRVHDARHTAATLLLEAGVDTKVAAAILGHANPQLTRSVYQHVTAKLEADAASRIGAALWGVSEG
jgi:integrase